MSELHTNDNVLDHFTQEILCAEYVLSTQYSFDLAEPNYIRCLKLIESFPDQKNRFIEILISLFESNKISDEPIAFLMHVLRWKEIFDWAESKLNTIPLPVANGRPFQKIISAYANSWENKEFYKLFN